jgi:DNA-binding MarR family transcriptional regulator
MKHDPVHLTDIADAVPEVMRQLFGRRVLPSGMWELTVPQLRALRTVALQADCTMGELAKGLRISLGAATGLVDRLIQHGLVQREADSQDRRIVRVRLTDAGRRAHNAAARETRRRIKAALRALSAEEQAQVASALALLRKALAATEPADRRRRGA